MDDQTRRPDPPRALSSATAWLEWFGPLRLVTSAVAVVVVCAGVWFLVRSPTPPIEAALPRVATSGVTTVPAAPPGSSTSVPTSSSIGSATDTDDVLVHVAGAVERPGVYLLEPGARLGEAIERAGGATSAGRPHELNLALVVVDGMRVEVPVDGQAIDPALRGDNTSTSEVAAPIDVNVADAAELETLPGVGPVTADAIVAERDAGGPFVSVDDLLRVSGIGPATLERLRAAVTT